MMKKKTLLSVLALTVSLAACTPHTDDADDFVRYASQLLDSTFCYYQSGQPYLFNETFPRQEGEKVTYLAGEDTVLTDKVAYLWPTSGMFSAVNALLQATGESRYEQLLRNAILPGLACYYDPLRQPAGYQSYLMADGPSDRFYDDNIWLGIDFTESFSLTQNPDYLKKAEEIEQFVESGRDSLLGGGIYWCEQQKHSKNTCSNAPAAVLSLRLYQITGNNVYLKTGQEHYHWTQEHLQDPEDGLYWDNMALDGTLSREKYAYNSGQMLQAAVLLYEITQETQYLDEAQRLALACHQHFFRPQDNGTEKGRILRNGNIWFAAILLRGFEELYHQTGDTRYLKDFVVSLQQLWEQNPAANRLFEDDRLDSDSPSKDKNNKWLLTQAALVEMYARLGNILTHEKQK